MNEFWLWALFQLFWLLEAGLQVLKKISLFVGTCINKESWKRNLIHHFLIAKTARWLFCSIATFAVTRLGNRPWSRDLSSLSHITAHRSSPRPPLLLSFPRPPHLQQSAVRSSTKTTKTEQPNTQPKTNQMRWSALRTVPSALNCNTWWINTGLNREMKWNTVRIPRIFVWFDHFEVQTW